MGNWLENERNRIDAEWEQLKTEKGYKDYLELPDGAWVPVDFNTEAPADLDGDFGMQALFTVQSNGKPFVFTLGKSTRAYRTLVRTLSDGNLKLLVRHTGEGYTSKYDFKPRVD